MFLPRALGCEEAWIRESHKRQMICEPTGATLLARLCPLALRKGKEITQTGRDTQKGKRKGIHKDISPSKRRREKTSKSERQT